MSDLLSILGATPAKAQTNGIVRLSGLATPLSGGFFSNVFRSLEMAELQASGSAGTGEETLERVDSEGGDGELTDATVVPDDGDVAAVDPADTLKPDRRSNPDSITDNAAADVKHLPADGESDTTKPLDVEISEGEKRLSVTGVKDGAPVRPPEQIHPIEAAVRGALGAVAVPVANPAGAAQPDARQVVPARAGDGAIGFGQSGMARPGAPETAAIPTRQMTSPPLAQDQVNAKAEMKMSASPDGVELAPDALKAGSKGAATGEQTLPGQALRQAGSALPLSGAAGGAAPVPVKQPDAIVQTDIPTQTTAVKSKVLIGPEALANATAPHPSSKRQENPTAERAPLVSRADDPRAAFSRTTDATSNANAAVRVKAASSASQAVQPLAANPAIDVQSLPTGSESRAEMSAISGPEGTGRSMDLQTGQAGQPTPAARPEVARDIARQIAPSIMAAADGSVDIALSPKELGNVRMALTVSETGITLLVTGDRAETLDLMRRHADELSAAFREMGYESVAFSFGTGGDAGSSQGAEGDDAAGQAVASEDDTADLSGTSGPSTNATPGRSAPDGSLDMRI